MLLYVKSLQSCPTLCDPIDGSPPGSPVPGILLARTLEWVAISFSSAWKWKVKVKSLSRVRPSATPWTAAHQAPPSTGFSRQEYWSGVPSPCPCSVLRHVPLFDATWTAARLSCPSLFPNFQARIPNESLQEMELNSVPLECGLDSATLANEWQMWYMTLMRLAYKKMVTSALNSLALSLRSLTEGEASCPGF